MNRRDLIRTAGGVTAALTTGSIFSMPRSSAFADATPALPAMMGGDPLPLFTALPYLQPGVTAGPLPRAGGDDSLVIAWQTIRTPHTEFTLECDNGAVIAGAFRESKRPLANDDAEMGHDYAATIRGLKSGKEYRYRLLANGKPIFESHFKVRKGRGQKCRFVAFGDNSFGDISDRFVAYQTFLAKPDFVVNAGDVVYEDGTVDQFARYYHPVHNADVAGLMIGAPILRSTIVYPVIANHDVHGKDSNKRPAADFDKNPDSLGYYTVFHLPANGPKTPARPTPTMGNDNALVAFREAAGDRFPSQANYSFDNGDAHFLCLDSNVYIDPNDPALQAWIASDLDATDATWKFVVYHHPAFNVGEEHYHEQQMRVLCPLFEKHGVNIVLSGHEHTYQRTRPIRFAPKDTSGVSPDQNVQKRFVPGDFAIDRAFDGVTATKPDGIVYVTTGAGGKHLYDADWNTRHDLWRHKEDDNADYVAAFVSDRHSITVFDMDNKSLVMTQVDQWGRTIDRCVFTK